MRSKVLIGGLAAAIAVLLAMSPLVAQAAAFIGSADIINNTIKSGDVKNNSLKGKDIKDNKLTGADVNEATLGTVPSADKLDGFEGADLASVANVATIAAGAGPFAAAKAWTFTVPAGTHRFDYHAAIVPDTNDRSVVCYIADHPAGTNPIAMQSGHYVSPFTAAWMSASGIRTFAAPTTLALNCVTGLGNFSVGFGGIQVSYTKINGTTPGTLTPARGTNESKATR